MDEDERYEAMRQTVESTARLQREGEIQLQQIRSNALVLEAGLLGIQAAVDQLSRDVAQTTRNVDQLTRGVDQLTRNMEKFEAILLPISRVVLDHDKGIDRLENPS